MCICVGRDKAVYGIFVFLQMQPHEVEDRETANAYGIQQSDHQKKMRKKYKNVVIMKTKNWIGCTHKTNAQMNKFSTTNKYL